jgi:transposase
MSYTLGGGETMRPAGSPETLERRRHKAIALLAEGWSPVEVARHVHVDRRSVRRWRAAHDRDGPNGVASRPTPGRPSKLDAKARQRLEQLLLKGARASGFPTDLWTCPRVGEVIHRTFDVTSIISGAYYGRWDGPRRSRSGKHESAMKRRSAAGSRSTGPASKKSEATERPHHLS